MTAASISIGPQGRVVIPAKLRQLLRLESGTRVVAYADGDGRLVLERQDRVLEDLQSRFRNVPGSMVDDLITERRAEAAREGGLD